MVRWLRRIRVGVLVLAGALIVLVLVVARIPCVPAWRETHNLEKGDAIGLPIPPNDGLRGVEALDTKDTPIL